MANDTPPETQPRRTGDSGQFAWTVLLNFILVGAFVLGAIPILAVIRGFVEAVTESRMRSGSDWLAYGFAFTGLLLGAVFFAYAIKYYLSTAIVLLTTLASGTPRNGNGHGSNGSPNLTGHSRINGNGNANGYPIDLGYHPFVSVHFAAYNEMPGIQRPLPAPQMPG